MKLPPPKERELTALEITLQAAQPAGFYKDTENEDLDKRSDSRHPYKLHPLSYVELSRHGYDHLIEEVCHMMYKKTHISSHLISFHLTLLYFALPLIYPDSDLTSLKRNFKDHVTWRSAHRWYATRYRMER
jgi:hypothetical protein